MRYVIIPVDFGPFAYQFIPGALLSARQVVVWRPSLAEIQRQFDEDKLIFSARDFLSLIDEGHIIAAGRNHWYNSPEQRNANPDWQDKCPWTHGLDEELRRLAKADETKVLVDRRAIVAPSPRGYKWARQIAATHPQLLARATQAIRTKQLPKGILDRAARTEDERSAAVRALATARNVALAQEEVEAHVPIQPSQYAREIGLLGHRRLAALCPKKIRQENIVETIYVLSRMSQFRNFNQFSKFLSSPDRRTVLEGAELLISNSSAIFEMQRLANSDDLDLPWSEALRPNAWNVGLGGTGLAMALFDFNLASPTFWGGVVLGVVGVPSRLAEKLGFQALNSEGARRISWVTQLQFGKRAIRYTDAKRLRELASQLSLEQLERLVAKSSNPGL